MPNGWAWVLAVGLIAAAGCNKKSNANSGEVGDAGVDGRVGDAGTPGAGGGAGAAGGGGAGMGGGADGGGTGGTTPACNTLVDDTPAVRETMISGPEPVLNGGVIPDGTYVLTERYQYVLSCDCLVHGKFVVGGGGTTVQALRQKGRGPIETASGAMSTNLNAMNWDFTCPQAMSEQHLYQVITGTDVVALQTFDGNLTYEIWVSGNCNTVANVGSPVAEMAVAAAMPASTGGTLVDGTYLLTRRESYTGSGGPSGPTGNTRKATMVIANATTSTMTVDFAISDNGAGDSRERYSGTTPAGSATMFGINRTCPPIALISIWGFTAAGNTLVLVDANIGEVDTWTRQ